MRPTRARALAGSDDAMYTLTLRWPWWMHPLWAVVLLTGTTAVIAIVLGEDSYRTWKTPKYLDADLSLTLLLGICSLLLGILITSARVLGTGSATFTFSERQVRFLRSTYRVLLALAGLGYAVWLASALAQGVTVDTVLSVVEREAGAISSLKGNSAPIAGVTTLTQLGPLLVVLGIILRKLGRVGRWHYAIYLFAAIRGVFYAERLALLEVLIPTVLLLGALSYGSGRRTSFLRVAPLVIAPLALGLFAAFEYMRSWVYYQNVVNIPFGEWVSLRLLGYYVTSYNNSAIFNSLLEGSSLSAPYFTIPFFWNAPILENFLTPPTIGGLPLEGWWWEALNNHGNPEFTNVGTFLMVAGEYGTGGMLLYWLATGLVIGAIYSSMRHGGLVSLFAYSCLFVGLLELPRFIYWTQGRATPLIIVLIVLGVAFARTSSMPFPGRRAALVGGLRPRSAGGEP